MQVFGKIVAKIVANADAERYKRAKREMHLLQMFNKHQNICNIMHGAAQDAVNGSSASVYAYYSATKTAPWKPS